MSRSAHTQNDGLNVDIYSSQNRQPIQMLEESRDAVQTLHVGGGTIMVGSVDGHVRTYDLRMGELRTDYIGRKTISHYTIISQIYSVYFPSKPYTFNGKNALRKERVQNRRIKNPPKASKKTVREQTSALKEQSVPFTQL